MSTIGERLRELRKQKGFSQNDLAHKAEIDIRTLQRIENNETDPRGHTIQQLASALNVTPDNLLDWEMKEDRGYLQLVNLSGMAFLLFPLLGIIIPLVIWILKRNTVDEVDTLGKKILNFQITWNIVVFLGYLIVIYTKMIRTMREIEAAGNVSPKLIIDAQVEMMLFIIVPWLIFVGYCLILTVINAYSISKEKKVRYFPAIRFLS